jgi:class 3 adenylate cyclase/tetratricopeptide (TPR) repeat protein
LPSLSDDRVDKEPSEKRALYRSLGGYSGFLACVGRDGRDHAHGRGRAMREEHRVITALFADLAGSTALGERLDGEEVKLVVGEAIGRIVAEVERFGGYVKDLAGDGVLAFFGAPVSHEDDAERAARAAWNVLQVIAGYSSEVARGWGIETFAVRVGISTGPVALGPIGSGQRVEYAAFGDTVNTAARLQSAADDGTALVHAATQRLIEPLFEWSGPRALDLKGVDKPVVAFELRGIAPVKSRLRGPTGPTAPLVGRDSEVLVLHDALEGLLAGRGSIVSITGEAGVGKSRLLAELHERSQSEDAAATLLWLEARCASYGEQIPYFPFRDLLRNWLGVNDNDPEVRVRISLRRAVDQLFDGTADETYPYLAGLLGLARADEAPGDETRLTAEELQHRTFAAIRNLLHRLAADRPIVVAVEDLHWADPSSTMLATSVLPVVEQAAVLLVMTQRDERDNAAWRLKEAAARDFPHVIREMSLDALHPGAERLLLDELIGAGTLTAPLERRLLEASGGNPLFLEELVRSLVDAGALVQGEDGWKLDHDVPIFIPQTVERVILARADRLAPTCREVLTAASVVGRRFGLSVLADLVSPQVSLEKVMHDLQRLGFVAQEGRWPEPAYRFKHVLIQEAIYGTMLSDERSRLHRAAAESLERQLRETQEDVLSLARHWDAAGFPERAIDYYRKGAELAIRTFANQEAIEALDHALELLDHTPASPARDELELDLRTMLGVPLVARESFGSARVSHEYSRARDLCIGLGRPVSPPVLRGLAINSVVRLRLSDAREHGTALLDAAKSNEDTVLTVEANYVLGVTSFWAGEFLESRRYLEQALARYSPENHERHVSFFSQDPQVVCLCRLAWTVSILGDLEQGRRLREESIARAQELGHPFTLLYALSHGALMSENVRDDGAAQELLEPVQSAAAKQGNEFWLNIGTMLKHWYLAQATSNESETEAMRAVIATSAGLGQPLFRTYFLSLLARAHLLFGDTGAGLEAVSDALAETRQTGACYIESELLLLRGELLEAAGGSPDEVEASFRLALDVASRQHAKLLEVRAALALTRWTAAHGTDADQTQALLRLRSSYAWFKEGLDAADLTAAREFLAQHQ